MVQNTLRLSQAVKARSTFIDEFQGLVEAPAERDAGQEAELIFEYHSLSTHPNEIRLLRCSGGPSSFEIHQVSLDNAPPYLALSYHWGDPTPRYAMQCDGRKMMITGNLMNALTAVFAAVERGGNPMWTQGEDIFLWADAICINQSNMEEKNVQVPLMAEIYRRARGTIGYIGAPPPGQNPQLPFLALARFVGANLEDGSIPTDILNNENSEDWLSHFWANGWFMRSWVTQEAALSREVICLYGDGSDHVTFSLDLLGSLIQSAQTPGRARPEFGEASENLRGRHHPGVQVYSWCQLRSSLRLEPDGINLVKVLNLIHIADATDKRDKVYSILGLLKREDREAIRVDYSNSNTAEQVYTDLARYCVGTANCMRMLEHAGTKRQLSNMPTWVPDWSYQPRYPLDSRHYRCAGNTTVDVRLSRDGRKCT